MNLRLLDFDNGIALIFLVQTYHKFAEGNCSHNNSSCILAASDQIHTTKI